MDKEKVKIVSYAHDLFVDNGFYKTTIDEIAKDLQMSKKTIYKHFSSKDELVEAVCDMRMKFGHEMISEIIDTKEDDAVTKFIKVVNVVQGKLVNCSERWLKDLQHHAPHCLKKFHKFRDEHIMNVMSKILEQGKHEKLIVNFPTQIIIQAYIGAITAVASPDFVINNKFSLKDVHRITSEIFFNGFLTPLGKEKYTNTKKLFEKVLAS